MSILEDNEMVDVGVLHLKNAGDELMYAKGLDGESDMTKPVRVHLYGPGTKQFAKAMNKRQNRGVDALRAKGKMKESAEEAIQEQAEFNAACTQSFENIGDYKGLSGYELFMAIYLNLKLYYIRVQVGLYIVDTQNFSPPSTKVSVSTSGS